MTLLATARVNYPARLERSELLRSRYPFASQALNFYRHIAAFQRDLYEQLPARWGKQAGAGGELRSRLNVPSLLEPFGQFLGVVEMYGPAPLATESRHLRQRGATAWFEALEEFWKAGLLELSIAVESKQESEDHARLQQFLTRAFLQPCAEFLASAMLPPALPMTMTRCPRCNSLPLLGVLRPEGDGGKRYLQCSFCSQEWEFRRIFCAHCGEDREEKLAVYRADQFPQLRVETCESCKHLLRTIDLTKDGRAIPIVDDLAAIPLTLWAAEHGYRRIQQNLLGT